MTVRAASCIALIVRMLLCVGIAGALLIFPGCADGESQDNQESAASKGGGAVLDNAAAAAANAPEDDGSIVRDGSWARGLASGYCFENNDGWDSTASGIPLDLTSYTVAVALDDGDLLGREVEIVYEGIALTARVTDVGGFAVYGRVLDLSPAVWEAFGSVSDDDWGVRYVGYRIL